MKSRFKGCVASAWLVAAGAALADPPASPASPGAPVAPASPVAPGSGAPLPPPTLTARPPLPPPAPPPPGPRQAPFGSGEAPGEAMAAMKSLGHERYRIGEVLVDRRARTLSIPGRVLQLGVPLEYLAVAPHGLKDYESLLEVNAGGNEFNLGCILLGLDAEKSKRSPFQFFREPLEGQPVRFRIVWNEGGKRHEVGAIEALYGDPAEAARQAEDWVYVGSFIKPSSQRYAAAETGILVGFVHDATSVVEHRTGLGIGAYGSLSGNKALLPPVGAPVTLVMRVLDEAKPGKTRP